MRGDSLTWRPRVAALTTLLLISFLVPFTAGCASTPITGRRQLVLVPEQREIALGLTAYQEALANEQPSENGEYVAMVQRVGQRLLLVLHN